jgi:hypothetical protein
MGIAGQIGGSLLQYGYKAISKGASEGMTTWGKKLGHQVFGEQIPESVIPLLSRNGVSPIDAQTYGRAMEFDPTVREPLDGLFRSAGDGNDGAFDLLGSAAKEFYEEDEALKQLTKTNKKLAKSQRAAYHKMDDRIDLATTAKGDPGRQHKAAVAGLGRAPKPIDTGIPMQASTKLGDPSNYRASSIFSGLAHPLSDIGITEVHHALGLDDMSWIFKHQSYQGVGPNSPHPLIELGDRLFGAQLGNSPQNTVDLLGWMTKRGRDARVLALSEQVGDSVHSKTIDDLLGTSDFKPREMTASEQGQFEVWRQKTGGSVEEFMDTVPPDIGGKKFSQGSAGTVEIWAPGANVRKDTPLEVIKLTPETYPNRVQLAFDAMEKHGIPGAKEARKKWNKKLAKVDPTEDILGRDHDLTHEFINELKKTEGTALNRIANMTDDEIFNLPMEEAFRLYAAQMQEMETVLANVLKYRYGKVKEIFKELNPKKSFERLNAEEKRVFFMKNVNTIAVRGNIDKDLSLKQALKPLKGWNNHIFDTFGWKPQTLWTSLEEIEELAKEFAAKVPTTQPIPGVE